MMNDNISKLKKFSFNVLDKINNFDFKNFNKNKFLNFVQDLISPKQESLFQKIEKSIFSKSFWTGICCCIILCLSLKNANINNNTLYIKRRDDKFILENEEQNTNNSSNDKQFDKNNNKLDYDNKKKKSLEAIFYKLLVGYKIISYLSFLVCIRKKYISGISVFFYLFMPFVNDINNFIFRKINETYLNCKSEVLRVCPNLNTINKQKIYHLHFLIHFIIIYYLINFLNPRFFNFLILYSYNIATLLAISYHFIYKYEDNNNKDNNKDNNNKKDNQIRLLLIFIFLVIFHIVPNAIINYYYNNYNSVRTLIDHQFIKLIFHFCCNLISYYSIGNFLFQFPNNLAKNRILDLVNNKNIKTNNRLSIQQDELYQLKHSQNIDDTNETLNNYLFTCILKIITKIINSTILTQLFTCIYSIFKTPNKKKILTSFLLQMLLPQANQYTVIINNNNIIFTQINNYNQHNQTKYRFNNISTKLQPSFDNINQSIKNVMNQNNNNNNDDNLSDDDLSDDDSDDSNINNNNINNDNDIRIEDNNNNYNCVDHQKTVDFRQYPVVQLMMMSQESPIRFNDNNVNNNNNDDNNNSNNKSVLQLDLLKRQVHNQNNKGIENLRAIIEQEKNSQKHNDKQIGVNVASNVKFQHTLEIENMKKQLEQLKEKKDTLNQKYSMALLDNDDNTRNSLNDQIEECEKMINETIEKLKSLDQ